MAPRSTKNLCTAIVTSSTSATAWASNIFKAIAFSAVVRLEYNIMSRICYLDKQSLLFFRFKTRSITAWTSNPTSAMTF